MPRAYTSAACPKPWRIFGLELRPFSPGHYVLLDALDNAFVSEDPRTVSQADLILGALICSRTFAEGKELVADVDRMKSATEALGTPAGWFIGLDPLLTFEQFLTDRARMFHDYITEASQEPKYWVVNQSEHHSGVHWFTAMKLALTGQLGYAQEDFWDAPFAQCLTDYLGFAAQSGTISLMTESDLAQMAAAEVRA